MDVQVSGSTALAANYTDNYLHLGHPIALRLCILHGRYHTPSAHLFVSFTGG